MGIDSAESRFVVRTKNRKRAATNGATCDVCLSGDHRCRTRTCACSMCRSGFVPRLLPPQRSEEET